MFIPQYSHIIKWWYQNSIYVSAALKVRWPWLTTPLRRGILYNTNARHLWLMATTFESIENLTCDQNTSQLVVAKTHYIWSFILLGKDGKYRILYGKCYYKFSCYFFKVCYLIFSITKMCPSYLLFFIWCLISYGKKAKIT